MPTVKRIARAGTGWLLAIAFGCAGPLSRPQAPAAAPAVEMTGGGLLVAQTGQAELGLTLTNRSEQTRWVTVHFQTPPPGKDCWLAKELESGANHLFICPQAAVQADTDYPVYITVFADLEQTRVLDRLTTPFRFQPGDIQRLKGTP